VEGTKKLAQHCDLITFENEFVNLDALEELAATGVKFFLVWQICAPYWINTSKDVIYAPRVACA